MRLYSEFGKHFTHINLATCWTRLAKTDPNERANFNLDRSDALSTLRDQTSRQLGTFEPRHLTDTARSVAALKLAGAAWTSLWKELEGATLARLSFFNSQDMASTARAFVNARQSTPALLDAIAEKAAEEIAARGVLDFNHVQLASMAFTYAKAGHAAPALFDAIGTEATGRVRDFNPQGLTNTAWAFATAGHPAPALFDAIGTQATERVGEFMPRGLTILAYAFATAGHAAPELFDAIGTRAAARRDELSLYDQNTLKWAFPAVGLAIPAFLDEVVATEAAESLYGSQATGPVRLGSGE